MQLRVSTRLWLVFGTIFFLILLSALFVRHRLNQSNSLADQTSQQSMPMALLAADMKLQAVQVQQFLSDVSATHNPGGYKEAKEAADAFHAHADAFKSKFAQERNAEAMEKLAAAVKAFDAMYALGRTMAETYVAQGVEAGNVLMETFDAATESLTDSLDPFIEKQMSEAATNLDSLKASLVASQMLQWLLAGISIAFGSLCAFFVIRSLRLQLGAEPADVADVAQKIASGDLEVDMSLRNGRTYCGVFAAMCEMRDRLKDNFAQLAARQATRARYGLPAKPQGLRRTHPCRTRATTRWQNCCPLPTPCAPSILRATTRSLGPAHALSPRCTLAATAIPYRTAQP